jgi:hypothetical protein
MGFRNISNAIIWQKMAAMVVNGVIVICYAN